MNINRYNYEEFFLLYTDKELSETERLAVEEFVHRNSDLQEEFLLFQQSILRVDKEIVFKNKQSLMQFSSSEQFIHLNNYEEIFILYADDELSKKEKGAVEQFVYEHPEFQESFELIQEVKFAPDSTVLFPHKETLFRHEKVEKLISYRWWWTAAAAIIFIFSGIVWLNNQPAIKPEDNAVNTQIRRSPGLKIDPNGTDPGKKENTNAISQVPLAEEKKNNEKNNGEALVKRTRNKPMKEKKNADYKLNNGSKDLIANDVKKDKKPTSVQISNKINREPANTALASNIDKAIAGSDKTISDQAVTSENQTIIENHANEALFGADDNNENVIFANIPLDKKNTLRRFFRKASRLIDKTTAFRPKSKQGILIGNIEIAIQ